MPLGPSDQNVIRSWEAFLLGCAFGLRFLEESSSDRDHFLMVIGGGGTSEPGGSIPLLTLSGVDFCSPFLKACSQCHLLPSDLFSELKAGEILFI